MLEIEVRVRLTDVGDGLCARSESPMAGTAFGRQGQSLCVSALRLGCILGGMAGAARLTADILSESDPAQQENRNQARNRNRANPFSQVILRNKSVGASPFSKVKVSRAMHFPCRAGDREG